MIDATEGLQNLMIAKHRKKAAADFAAWIVESIDENCSKIHWYVKGGALTDTFLRTLWEALPMIPTTCPAPEARNGTRSGHAATQRSVVKLLGSSNPLARKRGSLPTGWQ